MLVRIPLTLLLLLSVACQGASQPVVRGGADHFPARFQENTGTVGLFGRGMPGFNLTQREINEVVVPARTFDALRASDRERRRTSHSGSTGRIGWPAWHFGFELSDIREAVATRKSTELRRSAEATCQPP